jgi:hypothetical protein
MMSISIALRSSIEKAKTCLLDLSPIRRGGGGSRMEGKGSSIRGREESSRQADKERRERAHSVGCGVGRLALFRSRQEAKQSQIKIRNPNIEIRNKLKNLNTNCEIPKPFVWNFVFLIDAEAVSCFRSSLDPYTQSPTRFGCRRSRTRRHSPNLRRQ